MSKIKVKNFGPIREGNRDSDGWIEIKKVTVFIGNQGSGKSTIAKLITTFTWIEKALTRGDYESKWFARKNKLKNQFLSYFRLENYFPETINDQNKTFIEYIGDSFHIIFEKGLLNIIESKNGDYPLPQIMYVPAERNFISNVRTPKALKLVSEYLSEFLTEYNNAKNEIKGVLPLPINNVDIEYNKRNDAVYVKGKDYRIDLSESSSGFQSLVPLYLVSWFLANSVKKQSEISQEPMTSEQRERYRKNAQAILNNNDLTDEQKRIAISEEAKRFNKTAFINIVEEPEQNLSPGSQHKVLNNLLEFNNMNIGNKLVMTSHSPYLINYLTLAVKANALKEKINTEALIKKLYKIVPERSTINAQDIAIYELNEIEGTVKKLDDYKGLPSDENYLNQQLAESNELFAQLLEIQQAL